MTAEVAILNAEGVVLAADSAVTVDAIDGQKAIPSASKIYSLSNRWPVAVMFYGSAQFMGVPWETLIKEYRQARGAESRAHVREYARDFLQWLAGSAARFSPESIEQTLGVHAGAFVEGFLLALKKELGQKEPSDASVKDAVKRVLRAGAPRTGSPTTVSEGVTSALTFPDRDRAAIARALDARLERVPLTRAQRQQLEVRALERLRAQSPMGGRLGSGLVFAGFGSAQWLPAVDHRWVSLLLSNGALKSAPLDEREINGDIRAVIMPVANAVEIRAFMQGIHPSFEQAILREKKLTFEGAEDREQGLRDFLSQTAEAEFSRTIANMVAGMPREELAVMAETLVNLCAFRQRLSGNIETVAGPVDVAVISKGDGLVWVKRKHYFPPELNPLYFQRRTLTQRPP